ncbi:hypothetical protein VPH35_041649 [Triticum aestivum]
MLRCRRVLHVRRIPGRRRRVPGLRHHREHRDAEAGGGSLLRADLPRDHRRVGHRARRPLLLGLLLQAGAGFTARLLPAIVRVALRARKAVLRPRPHHALLELQLRPRGARHRRGPAQQPRPCGHRCHGVVQDGVVVLDDATGKQAVLPRRDHRPVDTDGRRQCGGKGARVRRHHQHHQQGARVRQGAGQPCCRPDQVLPALLQHPWRRLREQPRLLQPEALRRGAFDPASDAVTTYYDLNLASVLDACLCACDY